MKKNNRVLRIGLLALVLTLVTASLVSGTFAKYVTTVSGTGTVTVANWHAVLTKGTNSAGTDPVGSAVTFDLFDNGGDTGVKTTKLIAPGTEGNFAYSYDTNLSDVARNITITLDVSSLKNAANPLDYLEFYSDSSYTEKYTVSAGGVIELLNKDVGPGADTTYGAGNVPVYWKWVFGDDATTTQNTADTIDGITPITSANVTLAFTATQLTTI